MEMYVLLKWKDFHGVFSTYEKALEYINKNERDKAYHYRFSVYKTRLDNPSFSEEYDDFKKDLEIKTILVVGQK